MDVCDQLLIGCSQAIEKTKGLIRQVADTDLNVLICGESGVGKELVAQSLHLLSHRKSKPFVKVNCAAIPGELLESELFGYEKGAFTGANNQKKGKFELAHSGTILLDEIGDMPLSLQSKMLQVLQDLQFSRLGGKQDIRVNCWVLAATNHDLEQDILDGLFREDLFYRLNIIRIYIPPLRERVEDIALLTRYFAQRFSNKMKGWEFKTDEALMDFFCQYSWPGNVRELKNTVKRLVLLGDWDTLRKEMLARETRRCDLIEELEAQPLSSKEGQPNESITPARDFPPLKEVKKQAIRKAEREFIQAVLLETGWNRRKAAKILQISYKALLYKIKDLGLAP
jgi:transcriptional regulator with GAF, ATPase, and Fis domain